MAIPSGTVTFVFTDIEGSTRRWERDRAAMEEAVQRHDALLRETIDRHGGYIFKALGDAFCAAFARPLEAVAAALEAQRALAAEDFSRVGGLAVRTAVHTGTADERGGDYFGPALNRVARLLALAHGGQMLCSAAAAAVVRDELPQDVSLRDLGEHDLKDLEQSERVYQIVAPDLRNDFPPLRAPGSSRSHLPPQLTSFVGRERELGEIAALVSEHRIVTLIGSGGVGKTRTALHVAADVADDFADGVWLIELAALSSGDHVASTAAHALGVALTAGEDPLDDVVRALKAKRMLAVFDNCEHVAAPVARVVSAVAAGCPNVKFLASSRQPLEVSGEQTYVLSSLEPAAAIALFAERARAVDGTFAITDENEAVVAEICARLDGIPLAIELAASRAAVLSPKQIAQKLGERFRLLAQKGGDRLPRQQTLRAMIDWSYELLDDDERAVFARLSSFAGGWTLAAASAVCVDDAIDEWQVLDNLSALVTKSLVVAEPGGDERRYRMLNTIHEYGREQLAASGADPVASKHAAYFAEFVREKAELVHQLEDERWQRALAPEIDNIRAALEWAVVARGNGASGLHLLAHLEWPELITTPHEAVRWYDAAAEISDAGVDALTQARVMRHHVRLEWLVGRSTAQRERRASDAAAAARTSGDVDETSHALAMLGSIYRDARRFDEAERVFAEAHENAASLSPITLNALLRNWAVASLQRGDLETARARFTEVARRERAGSEAHASALLNIGELEFAVGNVAAAREAAAQARAAYERLNTAPLGLAICNLAAYAMAVDELGEARELLREALRIIRQTGARWTLTALEHHALLAALSGDAERAALLAGFTSAQYAGDDTRQTTERIGFERLMRMLRERYDETELAERMDAGARLSSEQALECAAAIDSLTPTAPAAMLPRNEPNSMASAREQAAADLDAHGRSIDDLHRKLAAHPGVNKEGLQKAVGTYKAAHQAFCDDALGCMN